MKALPLLALVALFHLHGMAQSSPNSSPVVAALQDMNALKVISTMSLKPVLQRYFENNPSEQARFIRCLWVLQEASRIERSSIENRHYEAAWVAMNDLFSRNDPKSFEVLTKILDELHLDGGERLAFEEKLSAMRTNLDKRAEK